MSENPTGGLDLPGTSSTSSTAGGVGPLAGVTPPRPLDPATTRLLDEEPAASSAPAAPSGWTPPAAGPAPARSLRVRTVVFGLVLLAIAGTVLVSALTSVSVDGGAVVLVLVVLAGVALLGGGLAAAVKEARGGPGA